MISIAAGGAMTDTIEAQELKILVQSVFAPTPDDRRLLLMVDVPDDVRPDTDPWRVRRGLAQDWHRKLTAVKADLGLEGVQLLAYPNVHSNNADLPAWGVFVEADLTDLTTDKLAAMQNRVAIEDVLADCQIVMAPTQLSTTAPMKLLARKLRFRAATMPGFTPAMLPALRIDYEEVNRRVNRIKDEVTRAAAVDIQFTVDGKDRCDVQFDLRHRAGHASGGRFPVLGEAGNLPSGECYIVPYEGERREHSQSAGVLPVQLGDEVVRYRIVQNRAVEVLSRGRHSEAEARRIKDEPAYANIAELGFGVLKDFGLQPVGVTLLDEKLGLHIAFGRSDHFGGAVGVRDFSSPEAVIHIDRIYIAAAAPRIQVNRVRLTAPDGASLILMRDGNYTIF
jgi:hypothetical protein